MAEIDQVLVPMDGSPLAEQGLQVALEEYPDAQITVLHVIDPTEPGYSYPVEFDPSEEPIHGSKEWYVRSEELADRLFEEVRELAEEYDGEVLTETAVGAPGQEIIDYATHHDVDEIIIGSHGRDETYPFYLGSVTEAVVFRSPVRVLLIR